MTRTRTPLSQRPRDLIYFLFFAIHLPITLLVDLQPLYPKDWVPSALSSVLTYYVAMSNDPFVGSVMGSFWHSQYNATTWFKTFLLLECFFQVPVFVLGLRGLWRGTRSTYILLLIYAASTATTTLPCLSVLLSIPTYPSPVKSGLPSLTAEQRLLLLSSYLPFFLVPFVMMLDMAFRIKVLVAAGSRALKAAKQE